MNVMADDRLAGSTRIFLIGGGILSVLAGILVVVWPGITLLVLAALLGINLVLGGVVSTVTAATGDHTTGERTLGIITGLLSLLAGAVVFARPVRSLAVIAVIIGAFWVVGGVAEFISGLTGSSDHRGLSILSGLLTVGAGVVILAWPAVSLVTMTWIAGIWMVVFGILRLIIGLRIPKAVGG